MRPELSRFFEVVGAYLEGRADLGSVKAVYGPEVDPKNGLSFYAWLVKHDQQRILGELYPSCRRWIERTAIDWADLTEAFVTAHRPAGWSVPHLGERFPDWLLGQLDVDDRLPRGIEAVADLAWTRFVSRNAPPTDDLGIDQRVHIRQYSVDVVAVERALADEAPLDPHLTPATILVYRHASGTGVRTLGVNLATVAVLVSAADPDAPLQGALAEIDGEALAAERRRLRKAGVLPAKEPTEGA